MFTWEFANENENGSQEGVYVEVIPNEKISYTWQAGAIPTLVPFHLKEDNGQTIVELVHSTDREDADKKKLQEDHANQWGFFMLHLKSYLEAEVALRMDHGASVKITELGIAIF